MKIAIIVIIIVLAAVCALTLLLPSYVLKVQRQTYEEAFAWASDHYDTSFYGRAEKTDYTIESYDGYVLHAQLLRDPANSPGSGRYVIITHGYTDNMRGSLKYAWFYLDLGFSCILYDLRAHGKNEPSYTTYGVRESRDLICVIDDTRKRYTDIKTLGLHGESLGSATTIMSLRYKPDVDFVVADCGFEEIQNVLRGRIKNQTVAKIMVRLADIGTKIRYGISFSDMRPIDALEDSDLPILFMHGTADTLINYRNSQDMAARAKGRSQIHLFPGAKHAQSAISDPERYARILKDFLRDFL